MKVLVADKLSSGAIESMQSLGIDVTVDADLNGESLKNALREYKPSVLVVRSTKVSSEQIGPASSLELIVRAGAGYDNIDWKFAADQGIFVSNCPGKNAVAVAELAMGLMLSIDRHITENISSSREGEWNKGAFSKARGLKGQTLGIVGFGKIGQQLAKRAKSFDMKVMAWSRSLNEAIAKEHGIVFVEDLSDLAMQADIVSLHIASNPETQKLIGKDFLSKMPEGSTLINTSRGNLLNESELLDAMESNGLRLGLDVIENEPASKKESFQSALAEHMNVHLTHHIGASTTQASEAIGAEAFRVIETYRKTGQVVNCINIERNSAANAMITVRHLDRVGVLAYVLDELKKAHWNVHEMENLVFSGENAACARIKFEGKIDQKTIDRLSDHEAILNVSLIEY